MPQVVNWTRGARPGPDCVYIGRESSRARPPFRRSKWANPFNTPLDGDRGEVIAMFEEWLLGRRPGPPGWRVDPAELMSALPELRGKDLLCWCAPARCHGDVLLRLAAPAPKRPRP
jgi:hypothetical protein